MRDYNYRRSSDKIWAQDGRLHRPIKGSIEPTHGSVCSGAKKLQSMIVLKWLSISNEI